MPTVQMKIKNLLDIEAIKKKVGDTSTVLYKGKTYTSFVDNGSNGGKANDGISDTDVTVITKETAYTKNWSGTYFS